MDKQRKKETIINFEELNWRQIKRLNPEVTIFFIPIGPIEEHGPHLPLGTDFLPPRDAANRAIINLTRKYNDMKFILYPLIPLGYCRVASDFPGTISVSNKIIEKIIYGILSSLAKDGFKYFIICNSHMELTHIKGIHLGMKKVMRKFNVKVYEPASIYYYKRLINTSERNLGFDTKSEEHAGFHAGYQETSLMLYLYPHLVDCNYKDLPSIYKYLYKIDVIGKTFKDLGFNQGYVGSPNKATLEDGKKIFNDLVKLYEISAINLYKNEELPDFPKKIKLMMKSLRMLV